MKFAAEQPSAPANPSASPSANLSIITIDNVTKRYASGLVALSEVTLDIKRGEIFALLGPNGAGKTTLINIICGLVKASSGHVKAEGFDTVSNYREARSRIGLVPQELTADMFERVLSSVSLSRGLFGKPANPKFIEEVLRKLSLWEKKDSQIMALSGGMKRRVMIAKALSHEPKILFLDEPTAGVDVALRRDMWEMVLELRRSGVTIILTTHYIEEAQEMADRVGIINKGKIILVEEKNSLMKKLGKKTLILQLTAPLDSLPAGFRDGLVAGRITMANDGSKLLYTYDASGESGAGVYELLSELTGLGIKYSDLQTTESSLEDIFLTLVGGHK